MLKGDINDAESLIGAIKGKFLVIDKEKLGELWRN
jgi:hypothetical protein